MTFLRLLRLIENKVLNPNCLDSAFVEVLERDMVILHKCSTGYAAWQAERHVGIFE